VTQRLLIIGNGMASVRLVEALTREGRGRFHITVVGAEPEAGYNRVLLSALLAGDVTPDDTLMKPRAWYAARGVDLVTGEAVAWVDAAARKATLAGGQRLGFDQCVFATGSDPIRLPIPGMDLPGVITFRDLRDVAVMDEAGGRGAHVAVIGGGLLGIEAAYGLAKRGAKVTLMHVMDRLMERQLDQPAAALLKRKLEAKGVTVKLAAQTLSVSGTNRADGLRFADGSHCPADLVVCAVGIRPNAALAKAAGLAVNRGIVVDDLMQASLPGFHAVGECAEHRGVAYGLVEPAYAQAEALAAALHGEDGSFGGMVLATNLKVSGVPVFSAGDFIGEPGTSSAVMEDRAAGAYRKLVFAGSRLVGCVLVGEADDALWYLDLIRSGADITAARRSLLHGRSFAGPALEKAA
jgi:nitrite reductase (NADH) large subunit